MWRIFRTLVAAGAFARLASASFDCTVGSQTALLARGGLAEPVGDISITCAGPPGQTVRLSLGVVLDEPIANPVDPASGRASGVSLWLQSGPVPVLLQTAPRLLGQQVLFDPAVVTANADGRFALRVSGLRTKEAESVSASVFWISDVAMFVPSNRALVAVAGPGLLAAPMAALACCAGPPLPDTMDWDGVLARRPWTGAIRVTESIAELFRPADPADTRVGAMRILLRVEGLPPGSSVLVPDSVAGSNAVVPTSSGLFGRPQEPGSYVPGPPRSLWLSRVQGADRDGSGGTPVSGASPSSPLGGVAEAQVEETQAWAVYQVMDTDPFSRESAEIPVWIFTPVSRVNERAIVRISAMLAPVSEQEEPAPGAPVPRYRPVDPMPDCEALGDCDADYFPRLEVIPSQTTEFALQAGGKPGYGTLFVLNRGGHFAEWEARVEYQDGTGWVVLQGTGGNLEGSFYYELRPAGLSPGQYHASIVIEQQHSPTGANARIAIPIQLAVTEGPPAPPSPATPPPTPPRPVIWRAATVPFGFGGPFAPGGLMRLEGQFFAAETAVTVGGVPAQVLGHGPGWMLIAIPDVPAPARLPVMAANGAQSGEPYFVDLLRAAPSIVAITNTGGGANSEAAPAMAGSEVMLEVTGIAQANDPVWINVHDRWQDAHREPGSGAGLHRLRLMIPKDLPSMMTAVRVCVTAEGIDSICSHPRPIWITSGQ